MQERNTAVPDAELADIKSGHTVTGCRSARGLEFNYNLGDYNLW